MFPVEPPGVDGFLSFSFGSFSSSFLGLFLFIPSFKPRPPASSSDFRILLFPLSAGLYTKCHYDGCDGSLLDFWWWDSYREKVGEGNTPVEPSLDTVYPL